MKKIIVIACLVVFSLCTDSNAFNSSIAKSRIYYTTTCRAPIYNAQGERVAILANDKLVQLIDTDTIDSDYVEILWLYHKAGYRGYINIAHIKKYNK